MPSHPALRASPAISSKNASGGVDDDRTGADLADYIAEMSAELAKLAGAASMPMLTYFLNLARVEAEQQARARGGALVRREES